MKRKIKIEVNIRHCPLLDGDQVGACGFTSINQMNLLIILDPRTGKNELPSYIAGQRNPSHAWCRGEEAIVPPADCLISTERRRGMS